jgi:hypothetical protein
MPAVNDGSSNFTFCFSPDFVGEAVGDAGAAAIEDVVVDDVVEVAVALEVLDV